MGNRSTIEFIGLWEKLNNLDFKPLEIERFKIEARSNYFVLSPQRWIELMQTDYFNIRKSNLKNKKSE